MKHNWEFKRLGDVCKQKKEVRRASSIYNADNQIEYIDISSIDRNVNQITNTTTYCFKDAPSRAQQCVENEDVLVSLVRPNLKNIAIVNDSRSNLVASSGFCVLRGCNLLQRVLYYIVNSNKFTDTLIAKCAGAAYPAVKEDDIRGVVIPVPPMETQEQIVAELDQIKDLIAKNRELLSQLDALAQSLFYDTFGDPSINPKIFPLCALSDICDAISIGITYKPEMVAEDGTIVLRSSNIQDSKFVLDDIVRVQMQLKESQYVQKNDILMCSRNGSARLVGKVCLIPEFNEKMSWGAFMTIIRSK